jgi:hypothetical protein
MAKNPKQAPKQPETPQTSGSDTAGDAYANAGQDTSGAKEPEPEAPKQAPAGAKLTPVGKITVKTVYGVVEQKKLPPLSFVRMKDGQPEIDPESQQPLMDANPTPEIRVCRIVGFASGVKRGDSSYGPWAALVGEFAATNAETGEIFASKTAIIPGPMGEALVTSTESVLQEDAEAKVKFSCDVFVKRSARDPNRKYEYIVRPVIDAKLSSPALELLALEG